MHKYFLQDGGIDGRDTETETETEEESKRETDSTQKGLPPPERLTTDKWIAHNFSKLDIQISHNSKIPCRHSSNLNLTSTDKVFSSEGNGMFSHFWNRAKQQLAERRHFQ
eukprot:14832988-Ditylum_brightwellii.AAC.1